VSEIQQPQNSLGPPNPQQIRVSSGHAPCPRCGATNAAPVAFTWWGGVLGPRVFSVVRCLGCNVQYNGKTGGTLTKGIVIYTGIALGVGILVFVLLTQMR
jgi:transposase-like protein